MNAIKAKAISAYSYPSIRAWSKCLLPWKRWVGKKASVWWLSLGDELVSKEDPWGRIGCLRLINKSKSFIDYWINERKAFKKEKKPWEQSWHWISSKRWSRQSILLIVQQQGWSLCGEEEAMIMVWGGETWRWRYECQPPPFFHLFLKMLPCFSRAEGTRDCY